MLSILGLISPRSYFRIAPFGRPQSWDKTTRLLPSLSLSLCRRLGKSLSPSGLFMLPLLPNRAFTWPAQLQPGFPGIQQEMAAKHIVSCVPVA
ncbi:MAG: hypothetical protein [Caudoviricetes sp.]|nr:MAG: hypothetical protein [Caudoviricetes sp.]